MSWYFLDSSALVKRCVVESGTAWIRSIAALEQGHVLAVAQITQVEVVSGIMRLAREGFLGGRTARELRLLIDRHFSRDHQVITITGEAIQRAENLLERHPLRASDAVQPASAIESEFRLTGDPYSSFEFVAADTRLLAAAAREGLLTVDPNIYS